MGNLEKLLVKEHKVKVNIDGVDIEFTLHPITAKGNAMLRQTQMKYLRHMNDPKLKSEVYARYIVEAEDEAKFIKMQYCFDNNLTKDQYNKLEAKTINLLVEEIDKMNGSFVEMTPEEAKAAKEREDDMLHMITNRLAGMPNHDEVKKK